MLEDALRATISSAGAQSLGRATIVAPRPTASRLIRVTRGAAVRNGCETSAQARSGAPVSDLIGAAVGLAAPLAIALLFLKAALAERAMTRRSITDARRVAREVTTGLGGPGAGRREFRPRIIEGGGSAHCGPFRRRDG